MESHFSSPLGPMHRVHCSHLHAQQPLCEPGRWQPHNHLSFSWCCGSGSHTCFAAGASPHLPPTQPLVPHHTLSLSSIFPWSLSSCIAERQSLSLSLKRHLFLTEKNKSTEGRSSVSKLQRTQRLESIGDPSYCSWKSPHEQFLFPATLYSRQTIK